MRSLGKFNGIGVHIYKSGNVREYSIVGKTMGVLPITCKIHEIDKHFILFFMGIDKLW